MTSHYLNQWRPSLLTHICVTRPQWVKDRVGYRRFVLCPWQCSFQMKTVLALARQLATIHCQHNIISVWKCKSGFRYSAPFSGLFNHSTTAFQRLGRCTVFKIWLLSVSQSVYDMKSPFKIFVSKRINWNIYTIRPLLQSEQHFRVNWLIWVTTAVSGNYIYTSEFHQ